MSDQPGQTPYTPPQARLSGKPPSGGRDPRGSLAAGIGLFFACLVGGGFVAVMLRMALLQALPYPLSYGMFGVMVPTLLPWAAALALGIWLRAKGRTRTALGILVGFGIFVAAGLLLVAACFGLMAGLGNMH